MQGFCPPFRPLPQTPSLIDHPGCISFELEVHTQGLDCHLSKLHRPEVPLVTGDLSNAPEYDRCKLFAEDGLLERSEVAFSNPTSHILQDLRRIRKTGDATSIVDYVFCWFGLSFTDAVTTERASSESLALSRNELA